MANITPHLEKTLKTSGRRFRAHFAIEAASQSVALYGKQKNGKFYFTVHELYFQNLSGEILLSIYDWPIKIHLLGSGRMLQGEYDWFWKKGPAYR
jgi:hypothetical protein